MGKKNLIEFTQNWVLPAIYQVILYWITGIDT